MPCSESQLQSLWLGRSGLYWEESIIHVSLTGRVIKLSSKYLYLHPCTDTALSLKEFSSVSG